MIGRARPLERVECATGIRLCERPRRPEQPSDIVRSRARALIAPVICCGDDEIGLAFALSGPPAISRLRVAGSMPASLFELRMGHARRAHARAGRIVCPRNIPFQPGASSPGADTAYVGVGPTVETRGYSRA